MPLFNPNPVINGTNFTGVGFGNSNSTQSATANLLYLVAVSVPVAVTLTGLIIENGSTAAGNILVGLYNGAGSSLLASSASTAQSGTFTSQRVPFSSPLAVAPGTYIFAVMFSSASATYSGQIFASSAAVAQGGFSLPSSVTPPGNASANALCAMVSY